MGAPCEWSNLHLAGAPECTTRAVEQEADARSKQEHTGCRNGSDLPSAVSKMDPSSCSAAAAQGVRSCAQKRFATSAPSASRTSPGGSARDEQPQFHRMVYKLPQPSSGPPAHRSCAWLPTQNFRRILPTQGRAATTRAEKLTEHRICLTRIDPKILVNCSLDRFRPTSEVHPCTTPPLRPHRGGTPRPTLTGTDRSRTPCQLSIDKPLYHNPRTFREISTLDSANLSFLPLARESLERASFHTQVRRHAAAGVWRGGGA
jgi:hypothetical protein